MDILISMGLRSSLLIMAVILVRALLIQKLPKRTFSVLWIICAVKSLIPLELTSSFSVHALFPMARPSLIPSNTSFLGEEVLDHSHMTELWTGEGTLEFGNSLTEMIGGIVWILGVFLVGGHFLITYLRYRRMFSMSIPLDHTISWEHGTIRPVQIRVSDRIKAPLSYGLIRPVILFPSGMDWDDREAVELILAHETVHIRRLDGLVKAMFAVAVSVHWWNPLMWVMFHYGNRDAELACDEAVVLAGDGDLRSSYAMTLIRMEERRGDCGTLYSHFSENAIEERITAIMKIKKTSVLAIAFALCLVVGLTVVFATDAPEQEDICLLWPSENCDRVTMNYGERVHPVTKEVLKIDHMTISNFEGTALGSEIRASEDGKVKETGFDAHEGNYMIIDHGNGLATKYTHCQELWKETGDAVKRGEGIAAVGQTGTATGPCLGFYVFQDGEPVDPNLYF